MRFALALAACTAAACGGEATLTVDLRTDLVVGTELGSATTIVFRSEETAALRTTSHALTLADDLAHGAPIATFPGLGSGDYTVLVTLHDSTGASVDQETVLVSLAGDTVATVLVMRSLAVTCTGESTCHLHGGTSEHGECSRATTASCAPPDVVDCECAPTATARLFFNPPSGAGGRLQHVVVSGVGLTGLALSIDGFCAGGGGIATCDVAGPCAALPSGTQASVFTVGEALGGHTLTTPGTHHVQVFAYETGSPCNAATSLLSADFVIP